MMNSKLFNTVYWGIFKRCYQGVYTATKHPKYISGEMTEDQVFEEFLNSFNGDDKDGEVILKIFRHLEQLSPAFIRRVLDKSLRGSVCFIFATAQHPDNLLKRAYIYMQSTRVHFKP